MSEIDIPAYRIQIVGLLTGLFFIFLVGRLILKGKLREEYAVIWTLIAIVIFVFSIWRNAIDWLGKKLGVYDPPNLFAAIAIALILIYLIHLSTIVSKQKDQIKRISQELGILKKQHAEISKPSNEKTD